MNYRFLYRHPLTLTQYNELMSEMDRKEREVKNLTHIVQEKEIELIKLKEHTSVVEKALDNLLNYIDELERLGKE